MGWTFLDGRPSRSYSRPQRALEMLWPYSRVPDSPQKMIQCDRLSIQQADIVGIWAYWHCRKQPEAQQCCCCEPHDASYASTNAWVARYSHNFVQWRNHHAHRIPKLRTLKHQMWLRGWSGVLSTSKRNVKRAYASFQNVISLSSPSSDVLSSVRLFKQCCWHETTWLVAKVHPYTTFLPMWIGMHIVPLLSWSDAVSDGRKMY